MSLLIWNQNTQTDDSTSERLQTLHQRLTYVCCSVAACEPELMPTFPHHRNKRAATAADAHAKRSKVWRRLPGWSAARLFSGPSSKTQMSERPRPTTAFFGLTSLRWTELTDSGCLDRTFEHSFFQTFPSLELYVEVWLKFGKKKCSLIVEFFHLLEDMKQTRHEAEKNGYDFTKWSISEWFWRHLWDYPWSFHTFWKYLSVKHNLLWML